MRQNAKKIMPKRGQKAFSMVEMALAMGVVSFAMISLLGLLPVGLSIARDTIDITVQSQVTQLISNQVQLTDYKNIGDWNGQQLYFNGQGLPEEDESKGVFKAVLGIQGMDNSVVGVVSTDAGCTVLVSITNIKRPQSTCTTSFIVANSGGSAGGMIIGPAIREGL